jgi:primosomal protein N' (replication factor Y) (superfamily II helicase)
MSEAFVDVALQVPLSRAFTYRVPAGLALLPGMRVAVPFSGQKLPGFVLRVHDEAPLGVKRILSVAGCLEPDPVFPEELLRFLQRAADYYLAPVGEVLKAAAPLLPKEALTRLKQSGFVAADSELKGRKIAAQTTWRVRAAGAELPPGRFGARQRALLALLAERGELLLPELAQLVPNARALVRGLAQKGLLT